MFSRSIADLSRRIPFRRAMSVQSPFNPTILQNQVALVTGGSSGIGLEICRQLGKHGCSVVMMGRRSEVLTSAEKALTDEGIKAFGVQGDVRIAEDSARAVKSTIEKYGRLDCLINGAAGKWVGSERGSWRSLSKISLVSWLLQKISRRKVSKPFSKLTFKEPSTCVTRRSLK